MKETGHLECQGYRGDIMSIQLKAGINRASMVAGIVLGAGKGTRMKSLMPKVLHQVAGQTMVSRVLGALREAGIEKTVVVINKDQTNDHNLIQEIKRSTVCVQNEQRGTADAVASSAAAFFSMPAPHYSSGKLYLGEIFSSDYVVICAGDTPCLRGESLNKFIDSSIDSDLSVLAMHQENPFGYGRLLTRDQSLVAIVEEKDCDFEQRKINLVNTGIYFIKTNLLFSLLDRVQPKNSQGEYYLTDIIKIAQNASEENLKISWWLADKADEFIGVNDRCQLAQAEEIILHRVKRKHMENGVTFHLPDTVYIEGEVDIGRDCEIGSGTVLLGKTQIGTGSCIGHQVILRDVLVGSNCVVGDGSLLEGITLEEGVTIPPKTYKKMSKGI